MKKKSDTIEATKRFLADIAQYSALKRSGRNNGTEYTSREFQLLCIENNIEHEQTALHSLHQTGTAEGALRTLFEMA